MTSLKTEVIIVGAGPSGLLLSQLLHNDGISSIIVERTTKERVLSRIRAGVLERGTVEGLKEAGCDARIQAERIDHDGHRDVEFEDGTHAAQCRGGDRRIIAKHAANDLHR